MLSKSTICVFKTPSEKTSCRALYKSGKVIIKEISNETFIQPDVEDIVIVEIPLEIIRTSVLEPPAVRKEKEIQNFIILELSRMLEINAKIVASHIKTLGNKLYVFYMFEEELKRYLSEFPAEPDIVYPQFLSQLILLKKLPGTWAHIVLGNEASNISIFENDYILNTRIAELGLKYVFEMIKEETSFSLNEIERSNNVELLEQAEKIIESILPDLVSELEREIFVALNTTTLRKITINDLDGVVVVCDSKKIIRLLRKYSENEGGFNSKLVEPIFIFNNILDFGDTGLLGLLYRGGLEFGKVKSIRW